MWPFDDFNPLGINQAEVGKNAATGHAEIFRRRINAINKYRHIGPTAGRLQAADRYARVGWHEANVKGQSRRQIGDICRTINAFPVNDVRSQNTDGQRHILKLLFTFTRGDDDGTKVSALACLLLCLFGSIGRCNCGPQACQAGRRQHEITNVHTVLPRIQPQTERRLCSAAADRQYNHGLAQILPGCPDR